jgi:hypothetical protein
MSETAKGSKKGGNYHERDGQAHRPRLGSTLRPPRGDDRQHFITGGS